MNLRSVSDGWPVKFEVVIRRSDGHEQQVHLREHAPSPGRHDGGSDPPDEIHRRKRDCRNRLGHASGTCALRVTSGRSAHPERAAASLKSTGIKEPYGVRRVT
jgi:hypothetical protein